MLFFSRLAQFVRGCHHQPWFALHLRFLPTPGAALNSLGAVGSTADVVRLRGRASSRIHLGSRQRGEAAAELTGAIGKRSRCLPRPSYQRAQGPHLDGRTLHSTGWPHFCVTLGRPQLSLLLEPGSLSRPLRAVDGVATLITVRLVFSGDAFVRHRPNLP